MAHATDSWLDHVSDAPPAPIERVGLPWFEEHVPRKTWMMEGGCGRETWRLEEYWPRPFVVPLSSHDRKPPFKCNHCNALIKGVRYECMDCEDYDLCTDCEALLDSDTPFHPIGHPLKKWPKQ